MTSWILIIMLANGGVSHIYFDTKKQCDKAAIAVMSKTSVTHKLYPVTVCVESVHD